MRERPAGPARSLKARHIVAAIIPALIILLSVTGFVWAQKGVTVIVDGESQFVKTQAENVQDLLAQTGVAVKTGDVVTPAFDAPIDDGMTVVVRHAVPVEVVLADERISIDVIGLTVADALVAAGIDTGAGVVCDPPMDAPLTPGVKISVSNVFVRVVEETADIPFETVTEADATMAQGARKVVNEGEPGKMLRVYRVTVIDDVEGERRLTAERVLVEPEAEVVAVGTKRSAGHTVVARSKPPVSAASSEGRKLTVSTTGYAPGVDGVGTRTATGARAGYGVIAVDPGVIPLGTRVYIPGYGYAVAADTGGAISGNKIDLCFDTRAEAMAWGRRTVTITILQ